MRNINLIAIALLFFFGYLSYNQYLENKRVEESKKVEVTNRKGPKRKTIANVDPKPAIETTKIANKENQIPVTIDENKIMSQTKLINEVSQELDDLTMCYTHESFCKYTQNSSDIKGEKIRLHGDLQILREYYGYEIPNFTDKELQNLKSVYGIDPYSNFETIQGLLIMSYKMTHGLIVMTKDENGNPKPHDKTYDNIDLRYLKEPKACYTEYKNCDISKPSRKVTPQDKLFVLSVLKKELNQLLEGKK